MDDIPKCITQVGIMKQKELIVNDYNDIDVAYENIHKEYLSSIKKQTVELREWMSLISFLSKNMQSSTQIVKLEYPFTIVKSERPDFIVKKENKKDIGIEIVKVTSINIEALMTLSYKYGYTMYETDARLYNNDVVMSKKDLMGLFIKPGDKLRGSGILGDYKEKKWSELCYNSIEKKSKKNYLMDVMLLDDQHVQSSIIKNVEIGTEFLAKLIKDNPISISNCQFIISENQSGLLLIYNHPLWTFKYYKQ